MIYAANMKKSELKQIIREEIQNALNKQRYADIVAKQIVDKGLHKDKSEKELYSVIFDIVLASEKGNKNRTNNIVWGDEDFVPDVLDAIKFYKNQ
jgi:hypothetical protein